ncbi:hypothetical protein EXS62_01555 [Candidatus Kaiserbacteria bacterium]|nr:hypothetical protein [Candidatus Kaiserbacteria bacterium]
MNSIKNIGLGATVIGGLLMSGVAFAQTPPVLNVAGSFPTSVSGGAQNATVAYYTLSNPGAAQVGVRALPLVLANTGLVNNCRVQNIAALGTNLSSGSNVLTVPGTSNVINLDTPFLINANSSATLGVVCSITSSAPGFILGVAFMPGNVFAMAGGATTTSVGAGINAGIPFSGEFTIVGPGVPIPVPTPGLPNTGAGGQLPAFAGLLLLALLGTAAGIVRLQRA